MLSALGFGKLAPNAIFVAVPGISDELAYGLTYAVMEHYESFKENGPGMDGYQLSQQNFEYIFPYHPAAIGYYKEKGVWTAEHDKHNAEILKRQEVLATAWKSMESSKVDDEQFPAEWMKVRAAALKAAGMPVIFE